MKRVLFYSLMLVNIANYAQNKMGYTWIVGNNASYGKFDGTNNVPTTGSLYTIAAPNYPYIFAGGHSNICDSASGKLKFLCNGAIIFDTLGNIIENGDSIIPEKIYTHSTYPFSGLTQSSMIIPKGSNGLYYVFTPTVSDSLYNAIWAPQIGNKAAFDLLLYHVVDMNANGGAGKVIEKNKVLLHNVELHKTMMQACRHSNGVDWWLLKQGRYGSNEVIRFLVTKDSIYGPYTQQFNEPKYVTYDLTGQFAFNTDGSKLAVVQGKTNKLFLSDFDRCTGELYNPKVFNVPIDSTGYHYADSIGLRDSILSGVCFSPNSNLLYISKWWNIYQFEYTELDSALAWYRVKHGTDTTWNAFEYYGSLKLGPDNRIYIGKGAGGFKQFSVIDNPDIKGVGCGFCRKCFRVDNALGGLNSPPNMPDYTLGASAQVCWPLSSQQLAVGSEQLEVYPNPSSTRIDVRYERRDKRNASLEIYNTIGQRVYSSHISSATADTSHVSIDVSNLSTGVYYLRVENQVVKVIIE